MANSAIVPMPTLSAHSQVKTHSSHGQGMSMPTPQATRSITAVSTAVAAAMTPHLTSRVCHRLIGTG